MEFCLGERPFFKGRDWIIEKDSCICRVAGSEGKVPYLILYLNLAVCFRRAICGEEKVGRRARRLNTFGIVIKMLN